MHIVLWILGGMGFQECGLEARNAARMAALPGSGRASGQRRRNPPRPSAILEEGSSTETQASYMTTTLRATSPFSNAVMASFTSSSA